MDIYETEKALNIRMLPVGSRVTVDPPPRNTDRDFLTYVESARSMWLIAELIKDGWERHKNYATTDKDSTTRTTFLRGDDNLILTWNLPTYEAFVACTDLARRMNLKEKADRVELFATVRRLWPGTDENKKWKSEAVEDILVD